MKNSLLLGVAALSLAVSIPSFAQKENVGIGTTKPDQSALLDLSSQTKGLLTPRMSLEQRGNIQNPANGLMVYQTDFLSGFYYFDGKEWKSMTNATNASSVAGVDGDWALNGNAGTNPANDFIGTTDAQPLVFRVANTKAGLITSTTNLFLGIDAGNASGNTNNYNLGFGYFALKANTGNSNVAIGALALKANTSSFSNMAIGSGSMENYNGGSESVSIGTNAMQNYGIGSGVVAIGQNAGRNALGEKSVLIGYEAGYAESTANKLYISNSATTTPLVYGDFSAKFIAIGDVTATNAKRDGLAAQYGLLVQKGILTEKIKVATMSTTDWADYVFEKDYKRMPLEEVEVFVKENKHLPNVPTTVEMMASGSDLIKTDAKLLEKIEELTLYMIEMNKEIKALKAENAKLKK